jgi:hypothetical protein
MNQETNWVLLMKKNRSQKSRASVPLRQGDLTPCCEMQQKNIIPRCILQPQDVCPVVQLRIFENHISKLTP